MFYNKWNGWLLVGSYYLKEKSIIIVVYLNEETNITLCRF